MSLLNNALSGLQASQYAMNAASQNIANLNTPGYSRQQALLVARSGGGFGTLEAGNGVEVQSLRRVSDGYLTAALWRANTQNGYDDQFQTLIGQAEALFGSDELSINGGLDGLFSALSAATASPQSIAPRQQVIATAQALAGRFNQLSSNLDLQEKQLDEQADAMLANINTQAAGVAKLNQAIVDVQAKGGNTAALEDQRDQLVSGLAKQVSLKTQRQADGTLSLSLASGQPLVLGAHAATLSRSGDDISLELGKQSFQLLKVGGSLGANRDYKTGQLAGLRTSLNSQAQAIADQMNGQLQQGFDLSGNPGQALFTYDPANPAGTLALSGITPEQLAFVGNDGSGNPVGGSGDNSNLLALVDMKPGFYDGYSQLVGDLAVKSGQAQATASASASLQQDAQAQRDNVSGVNRDEEAASLMQYMQAYQANAKVITAADDLFHTLMGMF
ncbi:flagellar hook-associated protein FlgK [Gallaecimonas kandeliae]|uniref:flagellar hook-associated protein FlgK n=1 Tax=Gallaecimonas kandeliae TaxID=3029055 RepID=UPI00264A0993|nr:flagellar hook-associated protein FlgK [Gallaecimonas kandeliae]WKE66537.1 flagellar hook-associated protein FlgK [Gallaecimonas kandeliae]